MTCREARKQRREAERKARKQEYKRNRLLAQTPKAPNPDLPDEFTPEVIGETNAIHERVHNRTPRAGFISQTPDSQTPAPPPRLMQRPERSDGTSTDARVASPRTEINRQNAEKSTGPRTAEGKFASSRNSLKHGLASGTLIVPGEDPAAFESLLHDLLEDHQPANPTEELLVKELAQSFWLEQRALRLQAECFTEAAQAAIPRRQTKAGTSAELGAGRESVVRRSSPEQGVDEKRLAVFIRYQTTHQRAFHKALNDLLRLRKERTRVTRGFVSQQTRKPIPHEAGFVSQPSDPSPFSPAEVPATPAGNGFVPQNLPARCAS